MALGCADDVVVSVNQLACAEPGCPPEETVIMALPAGGPALKLSIHKALADLTEADIITAAREATSLTKRSIAPSPE